MIVHPEEGIVEHKGVKYPFDQEMVRYCTVPDGRDENDYPILY
jgi:hypothetical protein